HLFVTETSPAKWYVINPRRACWSAMEHMLRRDRRQRRQAIFTGRADLHVHSLYSDGGQMPEVIVRAASGRLDVVAITDHDTVAGAVRARDYAREHPELGVDVVVGEEISTLNGHLLAFYLSERVPPGLTARETIELVHAQGGLAVAAHPFH